jgi:hypothetical protein
MVRSSVIGAIFRKSLRLSGRARVNHSVGQVSRFDIMRNASVTNRRRFLDHDYDQRMDACFERHAVTSRAFQTDATHLDACCVYFHESAVSFARLCLFAC